MQTEKLETSLVCSRVCTRVLELCMMRARLFLEEHVAERVFNFSVDHFPITIVTKCLPSLITPAAHFKAGNCWGNMVGTV